MGATVDASVAGTVALVINAPRERWLLSMVCSFVGVGSMARGSGGAAHQPCLPQTSSGARAVTASTSAWVRLMLAAARFSWRCWTLVVPGIGSAVVVR